MLYQKKDILEIYSYKNVIKAKNCIKHFSSFTDFSEQPPNDF